MPPVRPRIRLPRFRRAHAGLALAAPTLLLLTSTAFAQERQKTAIEKWLGLDPFRMIADCDIVGQICLVILAIFSIISWGIMINKFLQFRQAESQTDDFVRECNAGSGRLEDAFKVSAEFPASPLAIILREAYLELEMENWYRDGYDLDDAGRVDLAKAAIDRVFDRAITNEISALETKLSFLATTITVCPFIGLLGTVWGIMIALQAFSFVTGTVSISLLAPGLSTGLMATVGGLFCAIPASVMYNQFTSTVRSMTSRMDAFASELGNIIQKQIAKRPVPTGGLV